MTRRLKIIFFMCMTWMLATGAAAQEFAANTMQYGGYLTNPTGTPVNETIATMEFSLYTSETVETASWTETHNNVVVSQGRFQVELGSVKTLEASLFSSALYLGIKVGSEALTPRLPLSAVPYAFREGAPFCANGQTNCSGTCSNLQTDASNCGTCGNVCPTGQACSSGVCGGS